MTILQYPNEKLNKPCRRMHEHQDIRGLYEKLCNALPLYGGVALSANQIGELGRMFIMIDEGGTVIPYVNPKIVYLSDTPKVYTVERCLSFPGKKGRVERLAWIKIEWQDLDLKKHRKTFPNLKGIIVQHELDHLNGITLADRSLGGLTDISNGDEDGNK